MLLKQFDITTVYVTHDHYEAMILADLLAIMNQGRIEQIGTYEEIYAEPRNAFVAGFLNRHVGLPPISFVRLPDGTHIGVRPEDIDVTHEPREGAMRGVVESAIDLPLINAAMLVVKAGPYEIHAQARGARFRPGDDAGLTFTRFHVFDSDGVRVETRTMTP